ncbi:unnamed protein product [Prorocentrum cordatum]|uniref:WWE domain-containing protein n=1 Tax=Prorocentrum cordatum TaxID=2364126 RepID=A0ABN9SAK6_9DINO|nr:unnamed protein product [Polarella glacialis]
MGANRRRRNKQQSIARTIVEDWLVEDEWQAAERTKQILKAEHAARRKAEVDAQNARAELCRLKERLSASLAAQWFWEGDDTAWHPFHTSANSLLEEAFALAPAPSTLELRSGNYTYRVCLAEMTQENTSTGKVRKIMREDWGQAAAPTEPVGIVASIERAIDRRVEEMQAARSERDQLAHELQQQRRDNMKYKNRARFAEAKLKTEEVLRTKAERDRSLAEDKLKAEEELRKKAEKDGSLAIMFAENKLKAEAVLRVNAEARVFSYQEEAEGTAERLLEAEAEIAILQRAAGSVAAERRLVIEFWRVPIVGVPTYISLPEEEMHDKTRQILLELSHQQELFMRRPSTCWPFQKLQITSVRSVHNPYLWNQYVSSKTEMREKYKHFGLVCQTLPQPQTGLNSLLPSNFSADADLNEVIERAHGELPPPPAVRKRLSGITSIRGTTMFVD